MKEWDFDFNCLLLEFLTVFEKHESSHGNYNIRFLMFLADYDWFYYSKQRS